MKTRCIIIDDEPLAIELMEDHISKFENFEVVGACHNAIEGLELLKSTKVDLIFLDIQMPMITGIEFLKSLSNPPKVIFTTAYREYAIESYELDIVDYLLKPISFDRFFKAINKFLKSTETTQTIIKEAEKKDNEAAFMFINMNKKHYKIMFEDILYAESLKDYVRVHTKESTITTKDKISDFEKKLPPYFLRTHRSYIVNRQKITAYTQHDIEIGKIEIPIGISYKKEVIQVLQKGV